MLPIAGTIIARVLDTQNVSIHGDQYIDLVLLPADAPPGQSVRVRAPVHALERAEPPAVGEFVGVTFLMQQVTGVRRIAEPQTSD